MIARELDPRFRSAEDVAALDAEQDDWAHEPVRFLRGLAYGLVLAALLWSAIATAIVVLYRLFF